MPLTNIKLINRNQVAIGGTLSAAGLTYPTVDGSSGQVITTNGQGTLSFSTIESGGASVSISDTAPSSPSAGDMWFDSEDLILYVYYNDGSSSQWVKSIASGIPTPIALSTTAPSSANEGDLWFDTNLLKLFIYYNDGDSNQWIEINSLAGNEDTGGVVNYDWTEKSANATMIAGEKYIVNTTSAPITITLPSSATIGDEVRIIDGAGFAANNNITVARNGHKIQGSASDLVIDTNRAGFGLVYYNTTNGWVLIER